MWKERIQTEVIPFMWNVQNREIYKDRGLLRPGEWRMIAEGYGVSFWDNRNVLKLTVMVTRYAEICESTENLWQVGKRKEGRRAGRRRTGPISELWVVMPPTPQPLASLLTLCIYFSSFCILCKRNQRVYIMCGLFGSTFCLGNSFTLAFFKNRPFPHYELIHVHLKNP